MSLKSNLVKVGCLVVAVVLFLSGYELGASITENRLTRLAYSEMYGWGSPLYSWSVTSNNKVISLKLPSGLRGNSSYIGMSSDRKAPFVIVKEVPSKGLRCLNVESKTIKIKNQFVNVEQQCLANGFVRISPISEEAIAYFQSVLESEEFISFHLSGEYIENFRSKHFMRSFEQYEKEIAALNRVL
ncbi:hypothetical protein [Vibrio algicola]|uniref:Uncharacterized protein n=1 Tax=Vibrio algicola TaxID=2662262 RepID=A0A5Q0TC19_9VIBR|nr:hypothetical protein [Vibrio algicola]